MWFLLASWNIIGLLRFGPWSLCASSSTISLEAFSGLSMIDIESYSAIRFLETASTPISNQATRASAGLLHLQVSTQVQSGDQCNSNQLDSQIQPLCSRQIAIRCSNHINLHNLPICDLLLSRRAPLSVPQRMQMKTGQRFPIWLNGVEFRTASHR